MFKIPKWEDDVPKSKLDFGKIAKAKKKNNVTSESPQKPVQQKTNNVKKTESIKKFKKLEKKKNTINGNITKSNGFNNGNKHETHKHKKKNIVQPSTNITRQNDKPIENKGTISDAGISKKKKKPRKRKIDESVLPDKSNNEMHSSKSFSSDSSASKAKKKKPNNENEQFNQEGSILLPVSKKKKNKGNNLKSDNVTATSLGTKVSQKKEKLRQLLQQESNRNTINVSGNKLRQRMLERLKSAQFRFLNEKLYTTSGSEAQTLFQSDPEAFHTYHQGYQQQLKKWPVNPLDVIVKRISKMPKTHLIADMGCGEAALSRRVSQTVRSFDLVAAAPGVEPCDMARTPLLTAGVDAVVYCLALMGTDLTQYLLEANRVLKLGGHLLIAEVESRFDSVEKFTEDVQRLGFKLKNLDKSNDVFFFMEFVKVRDPPAKKAKLPELTLKPCLYKRR